jgi:chitinase
MLYSTILNSLLLASVASAAPHSLKRRSSNDQVVVYWGQNGGGTIENNDLSTYCTSSSGIDVVVLAFLYEYGNGNNIASGIIGIYILSVLTTTDCPRTIMLYQSSW